jgi:ribonuclease Z
MSLDDVGHTVNLLYPAEGAEYIDRLQYATVYDERIDLQKQAIKDDGLAMDMGDLAIYARHLDHRIPTCGWRLREPDGRRMIPERLAAASVTGPAISRLSEQGEIVVNGNTVRLDDMSEHKPGQSFAFIMDTRMTPAAIELAQNADLVVAESTYASTEAELARDYGHMTAAQAAELARTAQAQKLVLSHFSQRYPDTAVLEAEARAIFPDAIVAKDLMRVEVPSRRR